MILLQMSKDQNKICRAIYQKKWIHIQNYDTVVYSMKYICDKC